MEFQNGKIIMTPDEVLPLMMATASAVRAVTGSQAHGFQPRADFSLIMPEEDRPAIAPNASIGLSREFEDNLRSFHRNPKAIAPAAPPRRPPGEFELARRPAVPEPIRLDRPTPPPSSSQAPEQHPAEEGGGWSGMPVKLLLVLSMAMALIAVLMPPEIRIHSPFSGQSEQVEEKVGAEPEEPE